MGELGDPRKDEFSKSFSRREWLERRGTNEETRKTWADQISNWLAPETLRLQTDKEDVQTAKLLASMNGDHPKRKGYCEGKPLQIVFLVVGSRGDVQLSAAVAKRFQEYGHQVRLATHSHFQEFVVKNSGLEYFPLGGDGKLLCKMVAMNRGTFPKTPSLMFAQRKQMKEIIRSLLPACIDPAPETGTPFHADAIIANPGAYGHQHIAKALDIPLQILTACPLSPTREFPNPLFPMNKERWYKLSYHVFDMMLWVGTRDIINSLRRNDLKMKPATYLGDQRGTMYELPTIYTFSPILLPKPKEWGSNVEIVGCYSLDLASKYEPPKSLEKWIKDGEKPIYIGFGSMPIKDPKRITNIIVEALEITGKRCILAKGWSDIGTYSKNFLYVIDDCPHDWLFNKCAAVVHHGGSGTTSAGLKAGCPTTIIPIMSDQFIWAERVHAVGVGPPPIQLKHFSVQRLVDAINCMMEPKIKERAVEVSKLISKEDGAEGAVKAFFKHYVPV